MAKFTREDDDGRDEPSHSSRSGGGAIALVLLAVGGVFALLVVAGGLLFLFAARSEVREQRMRAEVAEADARDEARASGLIAVGKGTVALPGAQAVMSRDEWTKLLVGKTRDELTELAGKPDRTSDAPPWTWSYDRRSLDPAGEGTDPRDDGLVPGGRRAGRAGELRTRHPVTTGPASRSMNATLVAARPVNDGKTSPGRRSSLLLLTPRPG